MDSILNCITNRRLGPVMSSLAKAPIFKNDRTTFERLEKFVSKTYFTDCNLRGRLYGDRAPLKKLIHYDCGQTRLPFAEAVQILEAEGREVEPGLSIGPSWSTHWFKVEIVVPPEWTDKTVHFRWDSGSEAMLWSKDGQPLLGLTSEYGKTDFPISYKGTPIELYVEVACNTMFGCGQGDTINPPDMQQKFTVAAAEIVVFREEVFQLLMDFDVLIGLAKHMPEKDHKRYEIMYFANDLVNKCDPTSPQSVTECHMEASKFFNRQSAPPTVSTLSNQPYSTDALLIHAIGNSHIDTAWLWPYDETKRKCARTFSTVIDLMEKYPDTIRFAVSQAQQLEWIRQYYPTLFERIGRKVKDGKFVPVGGCWVEMDGNIPSGESLVRQMLYGQAFFQKYFGRRCTEFWLPDTFGYPSQLPQLMIQAGMRRFLTQKMSWNLVNKFPHNTFWWKGLDGTKVLTHFPPANDYCSRVTVEEAVKIENNFGEKGRSRSAILLYGYGDGGGGPDEPMLEKLKRMRALPGIPQMVPSTPNDFFASVEQQDLQNLSTWNGELYLELHNGTYTTHCDMKQMNRQCEYLLRDCELLSTFFWSSKSGGYRNWEPQWKNVLLNQFHDVLPGTSISPVYEDARRLFAETRSACEQFLAADVNAMPHLVNSLAWKRIVYLDDGSVHELPPMSVTKLDDTRLDPSTLSPVELLYKDTCIILQNRFLRATVDKRTGQVSSLIPLKNGVPTGVGSFYDVARPDQRLNQFVIYDDIPLFWDAWDVMDYHLETGKVCETMIENVKIMETSSIRCAVQFILKIGGSSRVKQQIVLRADQQYVEFKTEIEWNERHKILKVEFPLNIRTNEATYEIQFGNIKRPTHRNTSWDSAKFEVCGHKWADVSECDFGVALLNDCKYGHSCYDGVLCLSIIRGSTAPDATADLNYQQKFSYALMPHFGPLHRPDPGPLNVIQAAYQLNCPARLIRRHPDDVSAIRVSLVTVDNPAVMVETVKVSEDGRAVIVRVYECCGGKAHAKLTMGIQIKKACVCDLLEEPIGDAVLEIENGNSINLALGAFQVQTIRFTLP